MVKKWTFVTLVASVFLLLFCTAAIPDYNPDRWKYVSAQGIQLTVAAEDKTSVFIAGNESNSTGVKMLGDIEALKTIESQGFSRETALQQVFPVSYPAIVKFCADREVEAIDARVAIGQPWKYEAEKNGKRLDRAALVDALFSAAADGGGSVTARYTTAAPTVTREMLTRETVYRSGFETDYSTSTEDRKFNVRHALKKFDGMKVGAGETVSFNATVGARTTANGYKKAKIIYKGKYVEGVGGGVCQASTTLYNALALSGMEIVTVYPHSLRPSYVAAGRDAMVNSAGADLVWRNSTNTNVYLRVTCDDARVRVDLYGEKPDATYKLKSVVTGAVKGKYETVADDGSYGLGVGEELILCHPIDGCESVTYLITARNGKETSQIVRRSRYAAQNGAKVVSVIQPRQNTADAS